MNFANRFIFLIVNLAILLVVANAWSSDELHMYNLVEETKMSFYEYLGVGEKASAAEIKKAYRKLSLSMHPDKNLEDPDAGLKFRRLTHIYRILKEEESRAKYDDILEFGLPDWREPVYYYRQLRKMSNIELSLGILLILIGIHYAAVWGTVYERRWNLEEQLASSYKRHKATGKKLKDINEKIAEDLNVCPYPGFYDILPFALGRFIIYLLKMGSLLAVDICNSSKLKLQSLLGCEGSKSFSSEKRERKLRKQQEKKNSDLKQSETNDGKNNNKEESTTFAKNTVVQVKGKRKVITDKMSSAVAPDEVIPSAFEINENAVCGDTESDSDKASDAPKNVEEESEEIVM